jgi:phosphonate transport system permease protein
VLVDEARARGLTLVASLHHVELALRCLSARARPARRPAAVRPAAPQAVTPSAPGRRSMPSMSRSCSSPCSESRTRAPDASRRADDLSMNVRNHAPALRDPAWLGRLFWTLAARGAAAGPCCKPPSSGPPRCSSPRRLRVSGHFLARLPGRPLARPRIPAPARRRTAGARWPWPPPDVTLGLLHGRGRWHLLAVAQPVGQSALGSGGRMAPRARRAASGWRVAWPSCCARCPSWCGRWCSCAWWAWAPPPACWRLHLSYGGMLGKVYADILESGDAAPTAGPAARTAAAACRPSFMRCCRAMPPELASYTVYRWECAIRSSVVLGFVGAGGLGQAMDSSMKMFNGGEVASMLLVFMAVGGAGRPCQPPGCARPWHEDEPTPEALRASPSRGPRQWPGKAGSTAVT